MEGTVEVHAPDLPGKIDQLALPADAPVPQRAQARQRGPGSALVLAHVARGLQRRAVEVFEGWRKEVTLPPGVVAVERRCAVRGVRPCYGCCYQHFSELGLVPLKSLQL